MNLNSFARNWNLLAFSMVGKRPQNEDRVVHLVEWLVDTPVCVFIACDGVGGLRGGAECADELIRAVAQKLKHLLSVHGASLLKKSCTTVISNELKELEIGRAISGASTMVVSIFSVRRFWNGYRCVVAWAGDSRAHIVDANGSYVLLTEDHHDEEKRLTAAFVAKDGFCKGNVQARHCLMPHYPLAFGLTTDGIHGKCTEREFQSFLTWCLLEKHLDSEEFAKATNKFLENNLSDNLSAVFLLRRAALPFEKLKAILDRWGEPNV